jgi:hypothetical protein
VPEAVDVIIEWIWAQVAAFFGYLLSLFPTFSMPSWIDDAHDSIVSGVETAAGLGNWVPLVALTNSFLFLMGVGLAVFAVRGFRIVLSLFTGGGGGAA